MFERPGLDPPELIRWTLRSHLLEYPPGQQDAYSNFGYCGLAVNRGGNAWHAGSLPGTMSLMAHTRTGMSWAAILNTRSPKSDAGSRLDQLMWEVARTVPEWKA